MESGGLARPAKLVPGAALMRFLLVLSLALAGLSAAPALAAPLATDDRLPARALDRGIPTQLDPADRAAYRAVFQAIRAGRWTDAQLQLDAMKPGPLHAIARAELYTARNSPKVELAPLLDLLTTAPELPQAGQIAKLALLRGATTLPALPVEQKLVWFDAAPIRVRARAVRSDAAAADLARLMTPFVKADDGASAEALLATRQADLTPEALTEWQQRVAWIYYAANDDANARRMAALGQQGTGEWQAQADWVAGLAAWRQHDCEAAATAFDLVSRHASEVDLRSAGLYWGSRAAIACRHPERVQALLQGAAQYGETFYGLLARQSLGMDTGARKAAIASSADWNQLSRRPNVRVAAALVEIGENALADEVLKYQAKIGDAADYAALTRLAGALNLAQTQLWLSHYGPAGGAPVLDARYPDPDWTPDGGWRVDKALVYAHTLQESKFDPDVVSAAGAFGLMQIRPGAASDIARQRGITIARADLAKPSTNIEVGQSYLEQLRDQPATGGLLPKVIAAYNAGPVPVQAWNTQIKDNGDPLLYIESIPYWETRGYVLTVLRNYWMYELQEGRNSPSRAALIQDQWPRFPDLRGRAPVQFGGASGSATGSAGGTAGAAVGAAAATAGGAQGSLVSAN